MSIPYLLKEDGDFCLMVDDKPFLALGGELHNSSGSDLEYMDRVVWPSLRKLGGNFYLTPVYWELLEPEHGVFDFDLVDGIILQARREKVRLGLLWFGIWKNGNSDYVPQWIKRDHDSFFLTRSRNGVPELTISPLCTNVIEKDRDAFIQLMKHLKEFDGEENTVIMVQVENEIGSWRFDRDFSKEGDEAFAAIIPAEVAEAYGKAGTWQEAFGNEACDYFMSYYYSKAVETIASAGKKEYPIPMYVNSVVERTPDRPMGAPDSPMHKVWMKFAPSIDFFSPDIYVPWFKRIVDEYHHEGNPLFIPETRGGIDASSFVIYSMGRHNAMGFNPFAIERLFMEENTLDPYMNSFHRKSDPRNGLLLKQAYELTWAIWPEIRKAHKEGRIHSYIYPDCAQWDPKKGVQTDDDPMYIQDYRFWIRYGAPGAGEESPLPAGMIIELGKDEFLYFGVNSSVLIETIEGGKKTVFISDKWEGVVKDGKLVKGRTLNGDERMTTGFTQAPGIFVFRVEAIE